MVINIESTTLNLDNFTVVSQQLLFANIQHTTYQANKGMYWLVSNSSNVSCRGVNKTCFIFLTGIYNPYLKW